MRHDALNAKARTAWYLAPEALTLILSIRANPPKRERHFDTYVQTRDEWTKYAGADVDALDQLHNARFTAMEAAGADTEALRAHLLASPQKVICAALGEYPVPCFISDMEEIDLLAANIAAAALVWGRAA